MVGIRSPIGLVVGSGPCNYDGDLIDTSEDARRGRCHPLEAGFWPLWMTPLQRTNITEYSQHGKVPYGHFNSPEARIATGPLCVCV